MTTNRVSTITMKNNKKKCFLLAQYADDDVHVTTQTLILTAQVMIQPTKSWNLHHITRSSGGPQGKKGKEKMLNQAAAGFITRWNETIVVNLSYRWK
jgi:hypothetical protein